VTRYIVLYRLGGANFGHSMAPTTVRRGNYHVVATVEAADLEALFRDMNAVTGDETCCRLGVRSMSVGDLAIDPEGIVHYCAPGSWTTVGLVP
jgi:hypothetical protein